jgi:hypothetical protein
MKGKFLLRIKIPYEILEQLILIKGEKPLENFIGEILQEKILSEKNKSRKIEEEKIEGEKIKEEKTVEQKAEIKTAAEIAEQKQTPVQVPAPGPVSTVATQESAKEEKKEEKPTSEELYEVVYEGKRNVVAEYKSFEDRTELYPVIPVSSKLWHNFLAKQANRLGIKAEAAEEDGYITKMVFYKKEGISESDKQMFKQSVDWVFRTALKQIPK